MDSPTTTLGSFLRSRRARLAPDAIGVAAFGTRRVPGLRREELAELAGVSVTYYARLEQGRARRPSPEVTGALSTALALTADESAYLHQLVAAFPGADVAFADTIGAGIARLMDYWSAAPVVVVNTRRDVLAATPLATRVNPAWTAGTNLATFAFTDPRAHHVYADWDEIAGQTVAGLRTAAAGERRREVTSLVERLRDTSETFDRLWSSHDVYRRGAGRKRLRVDGLGILTLRFEAFAANGSPGQTVLAYFADPASAEEEALDALRATAGGTRRRLASASVVSPPASESAR